MEVRVLSVRQPYADEIIFGDKWNEIRSRKTPYRGPIYIQASRWDGPKNQATPGDGVTGAIIGRVHLVDCVEEHHLDAVDQHLSRKTTLPNWLKPLADYLRTLPKDSWLHGVGRWNWLLMEPAPLRQPFAIPGKLNLWHADLPAEQLRCARKSFLRSQPTAADYPKWTAPPPRPADLDALPKIGAKLVSGHPKENKVTVRVPVGNKLETVDFVYEGKQVQMRYRKRGRNRFARGVNRVHYKNGDAWYKSGCEVAWVLFPEAFPAGRSFMPR